MVIWIIFSTPMTPVFFGGSKRMTSLVFLSKVEKIHNKQTIIKIQLISTGGKFDTWRNCLWKMVILKSLWSLNKNSRHWLILRFSRLSYWIQTPFRTVPSILPTVVENWSHKVCWLVVSTRLKNISQNGNPPQIGVKIKDVWNHHLVWLFGGPNNDTI